MTPSLSLGTTNMSTFKISFDRRSVQHWMFLHLLRSCRSRMKNQRSRWSMLFNFVLIAIETIREEIVSRHYRKGIHTRKFSISSCSIKCMWSSSRTDIDGGRMIGREKHSISLPLCLDSSTCLHGSVRRLTDYWRIWNIVVRKHRFESVVAVSSCFFFRLNDISVRSSMYSTLDRFVLFDENWGALEWSGQINVFARDRPPCSTFNLSRCVGHLWLMRQYDSHSEEEKNSWVMVCVGQRSAERSWIHVFADHRVKELSMLSDFCSFSF
jgi:hypothetical protein